MIYHPKFIVLHNSAQNEEMSLFCSEKVVICIMPVICIMQLLIFLGHSGTACTLYNVILKTLVVNRCHNIAQMEKKMMKKKGTQWNRL